MAAVIAQPNNTLYASNIDWKIKKPLLRRALYSLMTRHGKVLEIIALRKNGLRGQAFVVFDDVQAATAALQTEQGFTFFGKDLKLAYANEKSDRISKRDGTFVPRAKRRKREVESAALGGDTTAEAAGSTETANSDSDAAVPPLPSGDSTAVVAAAAATAPQQQPTHILFAESLPSECNEMMLAMLFRQVRYARCKIRKGVLCLQRFLYLSGLFPFEIVCCAYYCISYLSHTNKKNTPTR